MAKQTILKERGTGEILYPQTLASCVQTADGGNVEEGLEKAKFALFVDMWNEAWKIGYNVYGLYDPINAPDSEHPFMGNEIWMTYTEAIEVMSCWALCQLRGNRSYMFNGLGSLRTLPPIALGDTSYQVSIYKTFADCNNLEALRFIDNGTGSHLAYKITSFRSAFAHCSKLKVVYGIIDVERCTERETPWYAFGRCYDLEVVNIRNLKIDFYLKDSPKINLPSFQFLVQYAANGTTAITVTVHADVYAKLTGDTTNEAAAALTEEEAAAWQQVLADAVAKNISFATA